MHFLSCGGEFNHHAKYMCDSIYEVLGSNYRRITVYDINEERKKLGYSEFENVPYNINAKQYTFEFVKNNISWSNVVDYGAAPESYLNEAIKQDKIVFIRIERLFKEGFFKILYPPIFFKYYRKYIKNRNNKNVFFLCISAYAAKDLRKIGIKNDRVLEWAYCPQFEPLEINEIISKNKECIDILWCGRLIKWKHPELAIKVAKKLKKKNICFKMKIIGNGPMFNKIEQTIRKYDLEDYVKLVGSVNSNIIREYMKEADFFLGTSDKNEGWGVVINEAMNCGCCVIAREQMGAVPILIKNNNNGIYFKKNYIRNTVNTIIYLSENSDKLKKIRYSAYETIKKEYNPNIYAKRFILISRKAINNEVIDIKDGIGRSVY